ncbi:MAG: universal stress protein [Nitrospirota bacterium]|nr:universal stress protein [Nitrospirota bacterium]
MKILLATDGSEHAEIAAKFLTRLDLSSSDEVTVLHVTNWVPFQDDMESHYRSLKYFREQISPRILDASVDILKPVKAGITVAEEEGYPDLAIMDVAARYNADLIVVGAKGIKGITSFFVGSVARSVAINSSKPVLVVNVPLAEMSSGPMRILFAADGSSSAVSTASFLASIPFPEDTELMIMNVVNSAISDVPERFFLEISDKIKEDVARARTEEFKMSKKIIDETRPYLSQRFKKIDSLTKIGDPSIEILDSAEILNADIIAVGCRGLKGIKGMMGSVSRRILSHARCSVLIGKTGAS